MKKFNAISHHETWAAHEAAKRFPLSGYLGSRESGGTEIVMLEDAWSKVFRVKHSIAVNSGTSGLLAACMAAEIGPGDEVIVSPYTMSATAACPKLLGAKLIWADIRPDTFTIDPDCVEKAITARTKAIIATNLFGCPAHLRKLRNMADRTGLILIEDNAQAIFAAEKGVLTGTIGHIGVFSLNVHKHLQVGEGGVVVCNDNVLSAKLREAINHGEMRGGILGLNLRMTEVTAAMAHTQLNRGSEIMLSRLEFAYELGFQMATKGLPVTPPMIRSDASHSFYAWAGLLEKPPTKPIPDPWRRGYLRPLYHLPALERDTVFLPGAETVEGRLILMEICAHDPTKEEIKSMVDQLGECL